MNDLAKAGETGDESTVNLIATEYRKVTDYEFRAALKNANESVNRIHEKRRMETLAEQKRLADLAEQERVANDAKKAAVLKAKAEADLASLPQIAASKLHAEYSDNEVTADSKWKGKTVIVSGRVHSIEKDFMGDAYITFSWDEFGFQNVRCDFGNDMEALKSLKKGDRVKIKGGVGGFILHDVLIKDCVLLQ